MDAFERNKFNEETFTKFILANSTIVSYGFISAIDFDSVTVTLTVSDKKAAEKVTCLFMNLGNEQFSTTLKPALNMRVLVFGMNKAASGMYDTAAQITAKQGRDFIFNNSPAIFSSQYAICIPILRSNIQSLSSLIIDSEALVAEIKHDVLASLSETLELDLYGDTNIELHEGTEHFRGYYGNLEETFGMVQGASGAEKPGTYVYKETYGKYSSVEKNYESGMTAVIGKAYAKPFLDDPGAISDVASAPVVINLGTGAPVTLTFGDSKLIIKADTTDGFSIVMKDALKVNIMADSGKVKIGNTSTTLKLVLDKIADLCASINTIGGPAAQNLNPAVAAQFSGELKTLIAGLFE